ncbi:hypothetical protein [uncultured Alistipes sp.]|uniref:hypothetical protein n=1 Tax=uncultured Alistipes sp. TaxID=538949 RepID=UPI00262F451B|nr:hypothetical protein [uncultured Alistipes sp.]
MENPMPSFLHYFLRRAGIRVDLLRLRAVYGRHPLPHSIRSLSDTLDELCVPNMICRLEFDQLSELDGPFLVVSGDAEYPFQLVERFDPETRTVCLRTADNRLTEVSFDRFRGAWDGSALTIDRGEAPAGRLCPGYYVRQLLAFVDRTWGWWLAASVVCLAAGHLLPSLAGMRGTAHLLGAGVGWIGLVAAIVVVILLVRRYDGRMDRDVEIVRLRNLREQLLGIPDLFWRQLGRETEEEVDSVTAAPVSNYAEAEHTVTVVLNPSCPDCARICDVIGKLKGVRIDLIFLVDDGDRKAYDVALRLISSGITSEWGETFRLLATWYGRGRVPATPIHPLAGNDLSAQLNYCRRIRIVRTPTILVDNRRLPAVYDAEDLKILL